MGEYKSEMSYASRVERLIDAVKDLEECAFEYPETRDMTIEILERYSKESKVAGKVLRNTADEVAALSMLEMLHD